MEGYIRPDFLFSYWILAWFLIYYNIDAFRDPIAKTISKYGSPLLALWIALFFNVFEIIYVSILKFDIIMIIKYSVMFSIIKIIPIYLLYQKGDSIHWLNDAIVLIGIILIYLLHLYLNGMTPKTIYEETEKSIVSSDNKTPMFYLMDKIYSFFTGAA
jgi:hypothetical protein